MTSPELGLAPHRPTATRQSATDLPRRGDQVVDRARARRQVSQRDLVIASLICLPDRPSRATGGRRA